MVRCTFCFGREPRQGRVRHMKCSSCGGEVVKIRQPRMVRRAV